MTGALRSNLISSLGFYGVWILQWIIYHLSIGTFLFLCARVFPRIFIQAHFLFY